MANQELLDPEVASKHVSSRSRRDIRAELRALKEGWDVPVDARKVAIRSMLAVLVDPNCKPGIKAQATRTLATIDKMMLDAVKLEIASDMQGYFPSEEIAIGGGSEEVQAKAEEDTVCQLIELCQSEEELQTIERLIARRANQPDRVHAEA